MIELKGTVSVGGRGVHGNTRVGIPGATFTPFVDAEGNLSWTNDGGLANPNTVNIKGPKGDEPSLVGYATQEWTKDYVDTVLGDIDELIGSGEIV